MSPVRRELVMGWLGSITCIALYHWRLSALLSRKQSFKSIYSQGPISYPDSVRLKMEHLDQLGSLTSSTTVGSWLSTIYPARKI
ncbi:hypothetical protein CPB86DRAFT_789117 [Serendipita vermifera]|nr:hypothetical protein CPB86DRAFT_789117 [Serendipita vermifera]